VVDDAALSVESAGLGDQPRPSMNVVKGQLVPEIQLQRTKPEPAQGSLASDGS
jgi:hypothetical protein